MPTTSIQIDPDQLAPPGIQGRLIIVDQIASESRSSQARIIDRNLREFEIRGALARYMSFQDEVKVGIEPGEGESYFLAPPEAERIVVDTLQGPFTIRKNQRNELATIFYSCQATTWQEAIQRFTNGITPFLDALCYHSDASVVIQRILCRDTQNRISVATYTAPYRRVTVNPHQRELRRELLPIYAQYREATNASSTYYRFLCYYKILEGIFRRIRPELMQKARSQGIQIPKRREVVPAHSELSQTHPEYVGQSIHELYERVLTTPYRDAVAHFALNSGVLLSVNDYSEVARFADIVLLSRLCAREVISTQEEYFDHFVQLGGKC